MPFRKSLLTITCAMALLSMLVACDNPQQKEARYLRRGNDLYVAEDYVKARLEYKNAQRSAPTDAEPIYRLGLVDEAEGDLRNAFANYIIAEQQNPHHYPATLKAAQYFMVAERYQEARTRIDSVLTEAPDNAEAHAVLASFLLREKNYADAEREALSALTKDPANITACAALTGIYAAQNDLNKAVAAVNNGIEHNPRSIALIMLRVMIYAQTNDLDKIAESYEAVFKLRPDESHFRVELADIFVKAGQPDRAEAVFRDGLQALPKDTAFKRAWISFLDTQRGLEVAEKEIQALTRDDSQSDDPLFWLADIYARHGDTEKAAQLLERIVANANDASPSTLNARTLLARLSMDGGKKEIAQRLIAAVLSKAPTNRAALLTRARMSYDDSRFQDTTSDLRTILREQPNDAGALQLSAETLLRQGHLDLAIDTMKKLVDLDPTNYGAQVRLAQMVYLNGDKKQAMEIVGVVTRAAPDFAVAWESAARFALDNKEWLPAQAAIKALDTLEGQHNVAQFLGAQILDATGKSDEAMGRFAKLFAAAPTSPLADHALTAMIADGEKLGRIEQAVTAIETVKTDSPFVATTLGKCYVKLGRTMEAATAFDRAIATGASLQDPYLERAKLYIADGKTDLAIDVLKSAMLAAPGDIRAAMSAADLSSLSGKIDQAVVFYEDVLARAPGFDAAANNLANVIADFRYEDSALLEKARKLAERFAGSTNAYMLDTLAWVYYRQGNYPQAQTTMERALAQQANLPPQVHYHYAAILNKSGKSDQARAELDQALATNVAYPGIEDARKMREVP